MPMGYYFVYKISWVFVFLTMAYNDKAGSFMLSLIRPP